MWKFDPNALQKKSQSKVPTAVKKRVKPTKKTAADWGRKENKVMHEAVKAGKIDEGTTVATLKKNFPPFEEKCHKNFAYSLLANKLKRAKESLTCPEGTSFICLCFFSLLLYLLTLRLLCDYI